MTIASEIDGMLDPILAVFNEPLTVRIEGQAVTAYLKGSAEMRRWARDHVRSQRVREVLVPDADFEGPPIQQAVSYAQKRGAKLVTEMNTVTKKRLAQVVSNGIKNKRGVDGLARDIRREFQDMARYRSKAIARNETSDALQQAFMDRSKDMGVTGKEWIEIAPLDQDCLINAAAGVIKIGDTFPSGHDRPPAHPNAVFAESPFRSYGRLLQIIRSRYCGPARTIQTDRVSFTIGPNHPILTRRGWVKASEIHEGDQLLYDTRTEHPGIAGVKPYLDQMSTIQDVFNALVAAFGYATIATPRAYFHGDEVSAYGEVEVVLPAIDLLPVLDALGIEELSQANFMRTDADALLVASGSPSGHSLNRIGVPPPGSMGSRNLSGAFFGSARTPPCFQLATVTHVETSHYLGWAYDASTSSTVYNSSGIVVKNCVCALAPVMIEELPKRVPEPMPRVTRPPRVTPPAGVVRPTDWGKWKPPIQSRSGIPSSSIRAANTEMRLTMRGLRPDIAEKYKVLLDEKNLRLVLSNDPLLKSQNLKIGQASGKYFKTTGDVVVSSKDVQWALIHEQGHQIFLNLDRLMSEGAARRFRSRMLKAFKTSKKAGRSVTNYALENVDEFAAEGIKFALKDPFVLRSRDRGLFDIVSEALLGG